MCGTIGNILRLITILLCFAALLFQIVNTISCNFVSNSSDNADDADQDYITDGNITAATATTAGPKITYGLWKMGMDDSVCFSETNGYGYDYDRSLNGARISHILSMVAGALALLLISVECIKCKIVGGMKLQGFALFLAFVTGLCVFMVFGMEGCGNVDSDYEFGLFDTNEKGNNTLTSTTSASEQWENFNHIDHNTVINYTSNHLVPAQYLESLASSFGSKCEWQEGASYNLVATLLYFVCGLLLCCTPAANPIFGGTEQLSPISQDDDGTNDLDLRPSWSSPDKQSQSSQTNARIV